VRIGWGVPVVVASACGGAAISTQSAQEQPALVAQATTPRPASSSAGGRGELKACTQLTGAIREIVEEVSVAYGEYERTHDLEAFERTVRASGDKASRLALTDSRLQDLALRYRQALLREVEALRHVQAAGPLSSAASQEESRGAVAGEAELLDELNAYCGLQVQPIDAD